jgi:pimeloyl-ACP methyl ester carboxylesterase
MARRLLICSALALTGCAWLAERQSLLALRPTPGRPAGLPDDAEIFRAGDERLLLPLPAAQGQGVGQVALWWLPHADPRAPTLLYLHGTFRNLYQNLPKINALRDAGFAIVAVDYRGWGDSTFIVPSEESIAADATLAWAQLMQRQHDPRLRVIYGHSLGGAVAVRLASQLHGGIDYGALVLESTFTRLPDVAAAAGFWGRLAARVSTLEFDSVSRIGRVDAPLVIVHGSADRTVPVALGQALRDAAPPGALWIEFPGGSHSQLHRELPAAYAQVFRDLIDRLRHAPPPRDPP